MRVGESLNDPYHDEKKHHKAALFRADGAVSALCFHRPRAIDLSRALWTIVDDAVTCEECLRAMKPES